MLTQEVYFNLYIRFLSSMIFRRSKFFLFFLLLQAILFKVYSQNLDSLSTISKQEKEDSLIIAAQLENIEQKKETGDKKGLSFAYHSVAQVYYDKKDYETSTEYFMLSLIVCRENHDDIGIADCYKNLADAHKNMAHYAEGIRYYSDAIDVYTELKYRNDVADACINISIIYEVKNKISEAISYTRKAQNIYTDLRNKEKVSECFARIKMLKAKR